jgi:hypothetical protein
MLNFQFHLLQSDKSLIEPVSSFITDINSFSLSIFKYFISETSTVKLPNKNSKYNTL